MQDSIVRANGGEYFFLRVLVFFACTLILDFPVNNTTRVPFDGLQSSIPPRRRYRIGI